MFIVDIQDFFLKLHSINSDGMGFELQVFDFLSEIEPNKTLENYCSKLLSSPITQQWKQHVHLKN